MSNRIRMIKSIVVDMTSKDETIKISNNAGEIYELNNVLIIGGNSKNNKLYIFAEGQPDSVAESLSGTFKWSRDVVNREETSRTFFRIVFMNFLRWLVENLRIPVEDHRKYVNAYDLFDRWEKEDREKHKEKNKEDDYKYRN